MKSNQKGFSLVELLVVVIIIAIVAAIAIPNLLSSRRAANEASAISSLRTIHSAEAVYLSTLGGNTGYATAAQLGTNNLVDPVLGVASATKSGYSFTVTVPATQVYCGIAKATTQGTTGVRSFGVSQPGTIYAVTDASVACDNAGAITGTGVAAIQ
jgi:type IV pilus assembly protein PilA